MNSTSRTLLIKAARLNGETVDLFIRDTRFASITADSGRKIHIEADIIIDARNKAIFPSFSDAHTSATATMLGGAGIDMTSRQWLRTRLHPFEGGLTEDDLYQATRLTCLKLIRCGITSFVNTGWHWWGSARAVEEMGLKAMLCSPFSEFADAAVPGQMKAQLRQLDISTRDCTRLRFAIAPVSVFEMSAESLHWLADFAGEREIPIHMELAATKAEVQTCLRKAGCRPAFYLDSFGLPGKNFSVVHGTHLNDAELELLAERGATLVHCPLAALRSATAGLSLHRVKQAGLAIALGGDGAAGGSLNMPATIRAALLHEKVLSRDPQALPPDEALRLACSGFARLSGNTGGEISVGAPADCILVDLDNPLMVPGNDTTADLIYSADSSCIDTTICNGMPLMLHRRINNEEEIISQVRQSLERIRERLQQTPQREADQGR